MSANKYKGKRITITFPPEIYDKILEQSQTENRTFSQQTVTLCLEAIRIREAKNSV